MLIVQNYLTVIFNLSVMKMIVYRGVLNVQIMYFHFKIAFEFTALLNARKTYLDPTTLNSFFQEDNNIINSKNDYYYFNTDDNLHNTATITQSSTYIYSENAHHSRKFKAKLLPDNVTYFAKLQTLISSLLIKPHIISINETWLQQNQQSEFNSFSDYTFISNCRKKQEGMWHYISKTISLFTLEMT